MTGWPATADRIAEAALDVFAVHGYSGASMEQIRAAAGVSNGSLYHHFPSRADLAAHLLIDGMGQCQDAVLRVLDAADSAEEGVRGVVHSVLGWVEERPDLARLLYGEWSDDVLLAAEPASSTQNRRYVEVVEGWLRRHADRGALIRQPFGISHALWLGPAQEFARQWLQGRSPLRPTQVAGDLADGARRALSVQRLSR